MCALLLFYEHWVSFKVYYTMKAPFEEMLMCLCSSHDIVLTPVSRSVLSLRHFYYVSSLVVSTKS